MAATLWAGEGSAVSHRAAAALWGLEGYRRAGVELTANHNPRGAAADVTAHFRQLEPYERKQVAGIAVTSLERTVLDLAGLCRLSKLEETLDELLRRPAFRFDRLKALRSSAPLNGSGLGKLRLLVAARSTSGGKSESALETRFLALLRRAGLPRPVQQHSVFVGADLVARIDFAYPEQRVALETKGYRYHSSRKAWERDNHRQTDLALLGWTVLSFSWDDVKLRGDRVAQRVAAALTMHRGQIEPLSDSI